jgi:hypothetical protein
MNDITAREIDEAFESLEWARRNWKEEVPWRKDMAAEMVEKRFAALAALLKRATPVSEG